MVGKTTDERKSTAAVASGREMQKRGRVEIIVCFIFLSIIAGMVIYIIFGLQAEKLDNNCISTPSGESHQRLATTTVPHLVYQECGGIVHVPRNSTVYIAYKNGSEYTSNERCLWVISSEAKQVILKFRVQNLEKSIDYKQDGFVTGQVDTSNQELRCTKWTKCDYTTFKNLSVPAFLHFTSNSKQPDYYGYGSRKEVDMERRGFVISLTAVEKPVKTFDRRTSPSISYVRSRKRGVMNLLDFETTNFPRKPVVGGLVYQNSFGVFPSSSDHGVSRRNFTCVGSFSSGNITGNSCCVFVDGYEIKKYHDGEACVHAPGLSLGQRSVVTEQSFIVFRWPQSDGKTTPCQVKWTE